MTADLYKEFNFSGIIGNRGLPPPRAIMTTMPAGDMKFRTEEENPNRQRFFSLIGIHPGSVRSLELLHTREVLVTSRAESVRDMNARALAAGGADGLVTQDSGCILGLTVADCMPIYLFDAETKAFGLLHSGWKGTGILKNALFVMEQAFGTKPENLHVILGPAIGSCCYRVQAERALQFQKEFGNEAVIRREHEGGEPEYSLDLIAANKKIARELAIASVSVIGECTCCSSDFGSYRRQNSQGNGEGNFSRNLALIGYFP